MDAVTSAYVSCRVIVPSAPRFSRPADDDDDLAEPNGHHCAQVILARHGRRRAGISRWKSGGKGESGETAAWKQVLGRFGRET